MELQFLLILSACVVNFEFTSVQAYNQTTEQAVSSKLNDDHKIQGSFQNLFNSIAKKNTKKSVIYHEILKQEATKEQQVFDEMKEDLQLAQNRNAYKKRNFYKKNNINENFIASKRETKENNDGSVGASAELARQTKKLPVGIENIRQIRQEGYIYVDKTGLIYDLMLEHNYDYLMVRPRGFGKTLFLSTLEEIFKGNKELFEGTAIHRSKYNWSKYVVLRFDFSQMDCREPNKFEIALKAEMKRMGEANGVTPVGGVDLQMQMRRLVEDLSKKSGARVVILVDEYDTAITNSLTDTKTAEKYRTILTSFFTVLTSLSEEFLQFTFVTGVNGFSVCGPQGCGARDNLADITLHPKYAALMGFTKEELDTNFADYIPANGSQTPEENMLDRARELCNGYRFTEIEVSVYNPLSILTYLNAQYPQQNRSYHEEVPSFLIDSVRKDPQIIFNLQNSATKGFSLQTPIDISGRINLEPFLFQTGYLTIHGYSLRDNWGYYELDFRNEAVKKTFFCVVFAELTELDPNEIVQDGDKVRQDLAVLDVNSFMATLHIHLSRIPIQLRQNATLEYYRAIFYLLMENYGLQMKVELDFSKTKISDVVILFKFTLNQSAEVALQRVMDTQKNERKKILCVGINFSVEASNINDWKAVLMDGGEVVRVFPK